MKMMTTNKKGKFKALLTGVLFFTICCLPYSHTYWGQLKNWKPYKTHFAKYKKIINKSNKERTDLLNQLENKKIDIATYIQKAKEVETTKKIELKKYHAKKNVLKQEYSFLGYSSFRYFLYAIGLPFLALSVSIFCIYLVFKSNSNVRTKKLYKIACIGFIYVSSFWVLRSFLTRTDFPKLSYDLSFVITAIISTTIIYSFVYLLNSLERKRKENQKEIENLILNGNELVELLNPST